MAGLDEQSQPLYSATPVVMPEPDADGDDDGDGDDAGGGWREQQTSDDIMWG